MAKSLLVNLYLQHFLVELVLEVALVVRLANGPVVVLVVVLEVALVVAMATQVEVLAMT